MLDYKKLLEMYKDAIIEENQAIDKVKKHRTKENRDLLDHLNCKRQIMCSNYIVALYENCLPEIVSLINLFEGQEYYIVNSAIEAGIASIVQKYDHQYTLCRIENSYSRTTKIYLENSDSNFNFKMSHKHEISMVDGNRIFKQVAKEDFRIKPKYIENPDKFVKEALTMQKEIDTLQNKLNAKIDKYVGYVLDAKKGVFERRGPVDAENCDEFYLFH